MTDARSSSDSFPWTAAVLAAVAGGFAVLSQTLLIRAFFEAFESNEFGLAAFFASWLWWVAVGAGLGRAAVRNVRWSLAALVALVYAPAMALQFELIARTRLLAGVAPQEMFPALRMVPAAALVNAPVSLVTGCLFAWICAAARAAGPRVVARVYMMEAIGGGVGGAAATLCLNAGVSDERLRLVGMVVISATAALAARRRVRWMAAGVAVAAAAALFVGGDRVWQERSDLRAWTRLLPAADWRGRFVTAQAVYRFGEREGGWIVQSGDSIVETVEVGPQAGVVAALHCAAAPFARRVLVAGPNTYDIAAAFLKLSSIEQVCWCPPDPGYAAAMPAHLPARLRPDPARFHAVAGDLRSWLAATNAMFDLIVVSMPDPVTLSLHRYVTAEFFELLRSRLAEGGVAGVRFSGGENYMGPDLVRLGASIVTTAESVFPTAVLQPGDDSRLLMTTRLSGLAPPARLARLFAAIPGSEALAPPEVVLHAFPPGRAEAQMARYRAEQDRLGGEALVLRDNRPAALVAALALGLRQSGHIRAAAWWARAPRPATLAVLAGIALLAALRAAMRWRRRAAGSSDAAPRFDVAVLIAAAGAAGMASGLLLMCAWQIRHGGLFLHIGLLSALFMLGAWGGAAAAEQWLARGTPRRDRWFLLCVAAGHVAALALFGRHGAEWSRAQLVAAMAAAGALAGLYVPAAIRRLGSDAPPAATGAMLEAFDHLGGMAGSLVVGLFILPALGLQGSVWFVAACVACAAPAALPASGPAPDADAADRWLRRLGTTGGWLLACAAVFAAAWRAESLREAGDPLAAAARDMLGEAARRMEVPGRGGRLAACYVAGPEETPERYCFVASDFVDPGVGYAGPIDLAVCLDRTGVLIDVRPLSSRETPRYFARLEHWWAAWRGWPAVDADANAPSPVDAVSGATVSSRAVIDTLRRAAPAFAAAARLREGHAAAANGGIRWPRETVALAAFAAAALVLRRRATLRVWARRAVLAACLGVFGLWLNVQFSIVHVGAWLSSPWPSPSARLAFVLPFAVTIFVALFGNVYCGWLCPFGAAQELVAALRSARWRWEPPPRVYRWARSLKYVLLGVVVLGALFTPEARLDEIDPLAAAFAPPAWTPLAALSLGALAASWIIPRFWCRALCPAGAWLAVMSALRPLDRFWPRVRPRCCDLGIRSRADLDCLQCDRCRLETAAIRREAPSVGRAALMAALAAVLLGGVTAIWVRQMPGWRRPPAAPGMVAPRTTGTPMDEAARRRIRERIAAGRLSDRDAMYWTAKTTTNAPQNRVRRRYRGGR